MATLGRKWDTRSVGEGSTKGFWDGGCLRLFRLLYKITETGWLQRHLFLTINGKSTSWNTDDLLLAMSHMVEGTRELSRVPFIRALISSIRAPSS